MVLNNVTKSAAFVGFTTRYLCLFRLLYKVRFLVSQYGPDWFKKVKVVGSTRSNAKLSAHFHSFGSVSSTHTSSPSKDLVKEIPFPTNDQFLLILGFFGVPSLQHLKPENAEKYVYNLSMCIENVDGEILHGIVKKYGDHLCHEMVNYVSQKEWSHLKFPILQILVKLLETADFFKNNLVSTNLVQVLIQELQAQEEGYSETEKVLIANLLCHLVSEPAILLQIEVFIDQDFVKVLLQCIGDSKERDSGFGLTCTELLLTLCKSETFIEIVLTTVMARNDVNQLITNLCLAFNQETEPGPASTLLTELLYKSKDEQQFTDVQLQEFFSMMSAKIFIMIQTQMWWERWMTNVLLIISNPSFSPNPDTLKEIHDALEELNACVWVSPSVKNFVNALDDGIMALYEKKVSFPAGSSNSLLKTKYGSRVITITKDASDPPKLALQWVSKSRENFCSPTERRSVSQNLSLTYEKSRAHQPKDSVQEGAESPETSDTGGFLELCGDMVDGCEVTAKHSVLRELGAISHKSENGDGLVERLGRVLHYCELSHKQQEYFNFDASETTFLIETFSNLYATNLGYRDVLCLILRIILEIVKQDRVFTRDLFRSEIPPMCIELLSNQMKDLTELDPEVFLLALHVLCNVCEHRPPQRITGVLTKNFARALLGTFKRREDVQDQCVTFLLIMHVHENIVIEAIASNDKTDAENFVCFVISRFLHRPKFVTVSNLESTDLAAKLVSDLLHDLRTAKLFCPGVIRNISEALFSVIQTKLTSDKGKLPVPQINLLISLYKMSGIAVKDRKKIKSLVFALSHSAGPQQMKLAALKYAQFLSKLLQNTPKKGKTGDRVLEKKTSFNSNAKDEQITSKQHGSFKDENVISNLPEYKTVIDTRINSSNSCAKLETLPDFDKITKKCLQTEQSGSLRFNAVGENCDVRDSSLHFGSTANVSLQPVPIGDNRCKNAGLLDDTKTTARYFHNKSADKSRAAKKAKSLLKIPQNNHNNGSINKMFSLKGGKDSLSEDSYFVTSRNKTKFSPKTKGTTDYNDECLEDTRCNGKQYQQFIDIRKKAIVPNTKTNVTTRGATISAITTEMQNKISLSPESQNTSPNGLDSKISTNIQVFQNDGDSAVFSSNPRRFNF